MDARSPFFQRTAIFLIGVMFFHPIASAAAGVSVNTAAGGNTTLGKAANGVPVINIATPNGSGLSHNKFNDYNVGRSGLILNNVTGKLQSTQLGGYIVGNPNLNGRAANIILNEVMGGSPSQLKGYTEVAGSAARVIVANPYGITCDGCGFINTPRVTLSTGRPVIENGRLGRYDVSDGAIVVEGAGLNAGNVDQFELITRSAAINAGLYANKLAIVTGRNEVEADTLAATAKAGDSASPPRLAIDSVALGGMYAGTIHLVGTERGVGVRLAGDMAASAGDIRIDVAGRLHLERVAASGDIDVKAAAVELNKEVYAGGHAGVAAQSGTLQVREGLVAAGDLRLNAGHIDNQGYLEAGVGADGNHNAASTLSIRGDTLSNRGMIIAQGGLNTDLARLDNQGGDLAAVGSAAIQAEILDNRGGQLLVQQVLTIEGRSLDNRGGTVASKQMLSIAASEKVDNGSDGLILGMADGLTVTTAVLDNQGGTLQANGGPLDVAANARLDNRSGKIFAGTGRLALAAAELDNRNGQLNAQEGALSATAAILDNSQGNIQASSIELATATRLDNSTGRIAATGGDLWIRHGAVVNDGGRLVASQAVRVDADSLRNQGGTIGGNNATITLGGRLNNDAGLVEVNQTLALNVNSASNAGGKLRALGGNGASRFVVGDLFDNDDGLVEIGNASFNLVGGALSNSQGTVRHVGSGVFDLNLADAGQAGGSFITNGELALDVGDWTNSSLLQAQKLSLKIGTFTQSASGKLLSVDSIEASGNDWRNDGAIETDGNLDLALTGAYEGSGTLKSGGDLSLASARLDLGPEAEIRSGGQGEVRVGGALINAGKLSAAGDLFVAAGDLDNHGALGSGQALRVESPHLLNRGLIFSGADMALRGDSLTNLQGDLYSLGELSIAKDDANGWMTLLENRSGGIESSGDMTLRAATLDNRKDSFTQSRTLTYGGISIVCYDCSGDHHNVDYVLTERFATVTLADSAAARIHSGGALDIQGGIIANRYSSLSASGDLGIVGASLENTGAVSGTAERVRRFNTGRVTDGTDERFRANYVIPYNNQPLPKEAPSALYTWLLTSDIETRTAGDADAPAIIQAGGNIDIQASQVAGNTAVMPGLAPQAGAGQQMDTQVALDSQPLVVQLNAQRPPDNRQQAVNPLNLPAFSLPQGQNGLFRVNANPDHPYLVETNPLFATQSGFLSSDYLLGQIGFDPEQTRRRLGDGLYEQRLIREAVVARTGKRFLAGLASDEAQFKYLMDNAIASREALDLSPGVALTAAQVAALTHDIVWLQEEEIDGQTVLVPVLYLAQADDRLAPGGALIQGRDVTLISGGTLDNSGTLRASGDLSITAGNIDNSGLLQANERVTLLAADSIRNTRGGLISGRDIGALALSGDILNERTITREIRGGQGFSQLTSVVDRAAGLEAGNDLALTAGRDILNSGGHLSAGGQATLVAGRDLSLIAAAAEDGLMRQDKRHFLSTASTTQHAGQVRVGGDLQATAGRDLAIVASPVEAGGDVRLGAGGDILIAAAANSQSSEYRYRRSDKKINQQDSSIRQQGASVTAGGQLIVGAQNDLLISASQLAAGGAAYLYANRELALIAAQDSDYHFYEKKKKGSWGSKKSRRDEVNSVTQVGSRITAGGDLTLESGGDQRYQVAGLEAGADLTLESGGDIHFEGKKDRKQESHEKSSSSWAWNSAKGQGTTDETLRQSQLVAGGELAIRAAGKIRIDIPEVNQHSVAQTITALVAAEPQLAWLKDMEQRGDIDWQRVKEVHDRFKYSHSGMGTVLTVVVAIVVTAVTWGWGATITGAANGSATAAAANAAVSAIVSNAAINAINTGGDLGKVLERTFTDQALKGYVAAALTAGLTQGATQYLQEQKLLVMDLSQATFGDRFNTYATKAVIGTGVQSTVMGRPLDETLETALVASLAQSLTSEIGDWGKGSEALIAKTLAHAVVQCAAAGVQGNDCGAAALGATTAELLSPMLDQLENRTQEVGFQQSLGSVIAGMGAMLVATLADQDAITALNAGQMVDYYNRQLHPDEQQRIKDLAKGDPQKEARLTAAGCALIRCAEGIPVTDPSYAYLKGLQDAGAGMLAEQQLLSVQHGSQSQNLFVYSGWDKAGDIWSQNSMGNRFAGAAQGTLGVLGVAGSAGLCTTGVGCAAGAVTGTISADYAQAGIRQAWTGDAVTTYGEQILQSLGLSPEAAAYTYAALGIAPAAVEALLAGKVVSVVPKGNATVPKGAVIPEGEFTIADRVYGQLNDSRLGQLAGKLDESALQKLANSPSATRVLDARTGHINVIQEVDGKLIRITVPRDEMKIISVGPIRPNQVKNLLDKGDFVPLK